MTRRLQVFRDRISTVLDRNTFARALAGGAAVVFGIQIVSFVLRYVSQVLFARWLGVEEYGIFVFCIASATLLAIPSALGYPSMVLRFIPEYLQLGKPDYVKGVIRAGLVIPTLVGVVLAAAVAVWLMAAGSAIVDAKFQALTVGVWLVPFLVLMSLLLQSSRGLSRMVLAYAPSFVGRHALLLAIAAVAVFVGASLDAIRLLYFSLATLAIVSLSHAVLMWRATPNPVRSVRPAYDLRRWNGVALPLLLVAGFNVILDQTDVILLGLFRDVGEVGIYNAGLKTSVLVTFVLTGVNAVAAPRISELWVKEDLGGLQRLITSVARLSFWPSLLIAILLGLLATPILSLFGSEFVVGKVAMLILIVGRLVNAGAGAVGYIMNLTGHQRISARVFAWAALMNVVLNVMLIPKFGMVGAALATMITMVTWNVWLSRLAFEHTTIRSSILYSLFDKRG
ncbi:MAG: oligosaccharide flippase family protein [Rhodothermia bacterium]|nr:oligosaccharide flippase family protein [Rhodothermia bacterium]